MKDRCFSFRIKSNESKKNKIKKRAPNFQQVSHISKIANYKVSIVRHKKYVFWNPECLEASLKFLF